MDSCRTLCKHTLICFLLTIAAVSTEPGTLTSPTPIPTQTQTAPTAGSHVQALDMSTSDVLFAHAHSPLHLLRLPRVNISRDGLEWLSKLLRKYESSRHHRAKRQSRVRVRREYRMLSDRDRNAYHRAVRMLKEDTVNCLFIFLSIVVYFRICSHLSHVVSRPLL
jgi:hypothetical protein